LLRDSRARCLLAGLAANQQHPGDEHPAAAEEIAGPAAKQQQPAKGQRVPIHYSLQAGQAEAQQVRDSAISSPFQNSTQPYGS